jgi:hypothetical protein
MAFRPSGYACKFYAQNLKALNPDLHQRVADKIQEVGDGRVLVELNQLDQATRNELLAALPLMGKMAPPGSMKEHEAMDKAIIDDAVREAEANNKREADRAAGMARLLEWSRTGNLEDTKPNSDHIANWLADNVKGYINVANIDAAISILGPRGTNVLTWRTASPVVQVVEKPQVELLPNGEPRLPLDASPDQMRRASTNQLRDLSHRRGEGRQRPGAFGSRF